MKPTGPNENVKKLIEKFRKEKRLVLAKHLAKPARSKSPVNVTKIDKMCKENDIAAVPGKVLGSGEIKKPVNVYALNFSKEAENKIKAAGGKCASLESLDKKARIII